MGGSIMASTINSDTSNGLILTPDTSGEIELQSAGTTQAKITSSGLQNASGVAITAQSGKNLIINGNMAIDQRNAGASVTPINQQYTIDRWRGVMSQSSKFSVQQNAGSVTPPAGFSNYLGIVSLSAYSVPSSEVFSLSQSIEGYNIADLRWGTANAKTVTLSFQVYSSLTGTFGGSLQNASVNRSYPFSFTVSVANTWTTISITIAGDTSGSWNNTNSTGILLSFGLGAGSTWSGTAGAWVGANYYSVTGATSVVGTSGATFYVTGVQLEANTTATPFESLQYTTQLQLCQRYYFFLYASVYGGNYGSGSFVTGVFPTEMRDTPTITYTSTRTPLIGLGFGYTTKVAYNGYMTAQGFVNNLRADAEL
jgi:hypothetical protein